MSRGYCGIGLDNAKNNNNIGAAMRAVQIYNAAFLAVSGKRYSKSPLDTMKGYKHVPLIQTKDLKTIIPYDCVPVAIELIEDAISLCEYNHPERAFYIFGAEDATLGKRTLDFCREIVYIPTKGCMNLAAAVNVVLYDRLSKND